MILQKNYRHALAALILLFSISAQCAKETRPSMNALYGTIKPEIYLTGQFTPSREEQFVRLDQAGIQTNDRVHYLHREAAAALKRMMTAFHAEHPKVKLWVQSSTRTFYQQKAIWDAKWNGTRKVSGKSLPESIPDPEKRALEILRFSSMPGTSRHHWGTDVDFNALENEYYTHGAGKTIYTWLRAHAHEYGFYQPYTAGREQGYEEERWHWSYLPLARYYLRDWMALYEKKKIRLNLKNLFGGSDKVARFAPIYVTGINESCK